MNPTTPEPAKPDVERRRKPRAAYERSAEIFCPTARPRPRLLPAEAPFCPHDLRQAKLIDRSSDGVGLVLDKALPIGAYQKLRLGGDPAGGTVPEVKIVRCEQRSDGRFVVGARRS